ncbi:MAG: ester cyclase [Actinomycetota bacterium]|jgi:ketosteroid isomerase-like protein|nr:MAG: hypothetical protein FD127_433 [Acidimicrobiaceae bacterium]
MTLPRTFPLVLLLAGNLLASCGSTPSQSSPVVGSEQETVANPPATAAAATAVTTEALALPKVESSTGPSTTEVGCATAEFVVEAKVAAANQRDWDRWEALHAADVERSAPDLDEPLHGAAALRGAIERLVASMPDYRLSLVDLVDGGDTFAVTVHASGTMTEPFVTSDGAEIPGTGAHFEQDWVAVGRLECGLIAEWHEFYDQYDLFVQLGFLQPLF